MQNYCQFQIWRRNCMTEKMNEEEFEGYVENILDRITDTLIVKGKEYSRNDDRLHNFNVGAKITETTREQVLDGFFLKHYISYRDMLKDMEGGKLPTIEYLEEKIGDMLIYLILFEASVKQKIYESREKTD